jgi:1,4-dihydroxy-2-naphthoyl-CoA hydrolase
MSVIDNFQERAKDIFPGLLGIQYLEASSEIVKASMVVRQELCTVGDILHGGAIMAFADTLGAVATVLNIPEGSWTATIESKTNFIRPARVGTKVIGESTALHKGKRTMTWQTKVMTEEGKLIAFVTQTQMVIDPQ